jgi:hypothetical protein
MKRSTRRIIGCGKSGTPWGWPDAGVDHFFDAANILVPAANLYGNCCAPPADSAGEPGKTGRTAVIRPR